MAYAVASDQKSPTKDEAIFAQLLLASQLAGRHTVNQELDSIHTTMKRGKYETKGHAKGAKRKRAEKSLESKRKQEVYENNEDVEDNDEDEDAPNIGEDEEEIERQRLRSLLAQFTPEQMRRYEHFRRSHFNKTTVKKLVHDVSGCSVNDEMAISMGGAAKIFAGQLVEAAREIMEKEEGEVGPIRPSHIRKAFREVYAAQGRSLRGHELLRR